MSRRWCIAAALAGCAALPLQAQVPAWSLEAQRRLLGGARADIANDLAERQRLAQLGESRLAAGDAAGAQEAFDRAALMVHSADIELGMVRSQMQAGEYRRALMTASHTAGVHRDVAGGAALYAWLLHLGGQGVYARRLLGDALERRPGDPTLLLARELLADPLKRPDGPLMQPPLRAAPYAATPGMPGDAHVAGSALLLNDGRHAVVPAGSIAGARRLWLRNALGQTAEAEPQPGSAGDALALLQLSPPLPGHSVPYAPREPFAGSPGYCVEYLPTPDAMASWPTLHMGFFGRGLAAAGERLLGLAMNPGPRGGPVFDAQGRLAGIAAPGADGRDRLLPIPGLQDQPPGREHSTATAQAPTASTAQGLQRPDPRAPVDAVYESAMRVALQLIVQP